MKKHFWIVMFLFAAGCIACAHTGGMSKPASYSFSIDIPEGWRKIDHNQYLFFTKESPFLQYILVQNRPIGRSFRNTKKKIQKDMLPEEAAQIVIDELVSDQNLVNLRILDNTPAIIKEYEGHTTVVVWLWRSNAPSGTERRIAELYLYNDGTEESPNIRSAVRLV